MIFSIIRTYHKSMDNTTSLRIASKAINVTIGPNGLVPSSLLVIVLVVFETIPNSPTPSRPNLFKQNVSKLYN